MTSRELEWFDLETRMRDLLHHQLIPILTKAKEDRDQINITKTHCAKLESRIKQLETMVFGDKDEETVVQEIMSKLAESEGNRKKDAVKFDQELNFVNEKLKTVGFNLTEATDSIASLTRKVQKNEEGITKVEMVVEHNKDLMMQEMENIGRNFRDLNATYTNIALRAEEKASAASDKAKGISLEIGMYKRELESIWKSNNELAFLARDSKANKLDIDDFSDFKEQLNEKFKKVMDDLTNVRDEFFHRDIFLEKFYPMKIVTMISDYFYHAFEADQLSKLADYESFILMEMNTEILNNISNTRDAQVQKILSDIRHVEERKTKLMRSSPRRTTKINRSIKLDIETVNKDISVPVSKPVDAVNSVVVNEAFEDGLIEKLLIKLDSEVVRIRADLNKRIDQLVQNIKNSEDNSSLMIKELLFKLTEFESEYLKDKIELQKELKNSAVKLSDNKLTVAKNVELLGKHAKIISFLIESFQIQQVLESQDEEDRHSLAQNLDKDLQNELIMSQNAPENYNSSLPSANFLLKKNCLACGQTTSMLAGMRTSVVYHPSPLVYREKTFMRPELLKIKGRLIQNLSEISKGSNKEDDVGNFFTIALKSSRVGSTGRMESESKELPSLNLSTSRNKTHKRSRYMIRSAVHSVDKHNL